MPLEMGNIYFQHLPVSPPALANCFYKDQAKALELPTDNSPKSSLTGMERNTWRGNGAAPILTPAQTRRLPHAASPGPSKAVVHAPAPGPPKRPGSSPWPQQKSLGELAVL